jgi:hypothetical protein
MIDTGGGPMFLSDPNGYVYEGAWPDPVDNPIWTCGSVKCQSTRGPVSVGLSDGKASMSYAIDPSLLPASAQGLTLVMCEMNEFMWGQQGMNVGGLSALFVDILVDYANARVGIKPKWGHRERTGEA